MRVLSFGRLQPLLLLLLLLRLRTNVAEPVHAAALRWCVDRGPLFETQPRGLPVPGGNPLSASTLRVEEPRKRLERPEAVSAGMAAFVMHEARIRRV